MFKIGNSKELPPIPDHLSEEGKDFIRRCLRRDPSSRPTAVDLLQHPFVQNAPPLEKSSAAHPLEQLTAISCRTNSKVSIVYSCCSNVIFQLINLHALLACRCVFDSKFYEHKTLPFGFSPPPSLFCLPVACKRFNICLEGLLSTLMTYIEFFLNWDLHRILGPYQCISSCLLFIFSLFM